MIPAKTFDLGFSALIALLGLYVTWQGLDYGFTDEGVPAAGYFPVISGIGMLLFAVLNIAKVLRNAGLHGFFETAELVRVGLVSLSIAGFILLSYLVGMVVATFPFMMAVGVIYGARSPRSLAVLAVVSAGMTAINYLVFSVMLGVLLT